MRIGLDIGSTTAKVAVLDTEGRLIFSDYRRHYSQVADAITALIQEMKERFPEARAASFAISGSAGMGLAEKCGIPFVQEVYATRLCAEKMTPEADVIIELGGEDAKILFFKGNPRRTNERQLRRGYWCFSGSDGDAFRRYNGGTEPPCKGL